MSSIFDLQEKAVVVTGGAGFLGKQFVKTILKNNGIPIVLDINQAHLDDFITDVEKELSYQKILTFCGDITSHEEMMSVNKRIEKEGLKIYGLVNNAAINPKVENGLENFLRLENYPIEQIERECRVGLMGALICTQVFGRKMAEARDGSIVNISSDLGIIAPNQSIYKAAGESFENQAVKPVSYSIIKHGLIGLTKYTATYWADYNIRCNAIAPGGVYNHQPQEFLDNISSLIPLKRLANLNELDGTIVFLLSNASSYITGIVLSVDGGRTCW